MERDGHLLLEWLARGGCCPDSHWPDQDKRDGAMGIANFRSSEGLLHHRPHLYSSGRPLRTRGHILLSFQRLGDPTDLDHCNQLRAHEAGTGIHVQLQALRDKRDWPGALFEEPVSPICCDSRTVTRGASVCGKIWGQLSSRPVSIHQSKVVCSSGRRRLGRPGLLRRDEERQQRGLLLVDGLRWLSAARHPRVHVPRQGSHHRRVDLPVQDEIPKHQRHLGGEPIHRHRCRHSPSGHGRSNSDKRRHRSVDPLDNRQDLLGCPEIMIFAPRTAGGVPD